MWSECGVGNTEVRWLCRCRIITVAELAGSCEVAVKVNRIVNTKSLELPMYIQQVLSNITTTWHCRTCRIVLYSACVHHQHLKKVISTTNNTIVCTVIKKINLNALSFWKHWIRLPLVSHQAFLNKQLPLDRLQV